MSHRDLLVFICCCLFVYFPTAQDKSAPSSGSKSSRTRTPPWFWSVPLLQVGSVPQSPHVPHALGAGPAPAPHLRASSLRAEPNRAGPGRGSSRSREVERRRRDDGVGSGRGAAGAHGRTALYKHSAAPLAARTRTGASPEPHRVQQSEPSEPADPSLDSYYFFTDFFWKSFLRTSRLLFSVPTRLKHEPSSIRTRR